MTATDGDIATYRAARKDSCLQPPEVQVYIQNNMATQWSMKPYGGVMFVLMFILLATGQGIAS